MMKGSFPVQIKNGGHGSSGQSAVRRDGDAAEGELSGRYCAHAHSCLQHPSVTSFVNTNSNKQLSQTSRKYATVSIVSD